VTYVASDGNMTFAVAPDASMLVISTASSAHLYDPSDSTSTPLATSLDPYSRLALGASSGAGTLTTDTGVSVVAFDAASGGTMGTSGPFDAVLDIAATDAGVVALVREGQRLVLIDAESRTELFGHDAPSPTILDVGAIDPSGSSFVVSIDGAVLVATKQALEPAGQVTRDLPVLAMLRSGQVVVASEQDGVHLVDPVLHVDLGQVCTDTVGVSHLAVSHAGSIVACNNGFDTEVWDTGVLLPASRSPEGTRSSDGTTSTAGDAVVELELSGAISIVVGERRHALDVSEVAPAAAGTPVVAALTSSGRGLAIGTSDGWVLEFDLGADAHVTVVQSWRVPTGAAVQAVGWSVVGTSLAVEAGEVWWSPRSVLGASDPAVAVAYAISRESSCWIGANLAVFDHAFREAMAMAVCPTIPEADD
jgi:hypothetical protein